MVPELAARLLKRLNFFDNCLQIAVDAGQFDWALEVVSYGNTEQKVEIYYRYAIALEDQGNYADAEKEFLRANKPIEAIQMYIHLKDWDAAENIAKIYCPEGLSQVLIAKAEQSVESNNYPLAESLLLRAQKPEIIINHYKVM